MSKFPVINRLTQEIQETRRQDIRGSEQDCEPGSMEKIAKQEETRKFQITNESGLHARPVSELVRCAMRFKSEITISVNGKVCSAVSIMDIMTADIRRGAEISVTAIGVDATKALDAIGKCLSQLAEKGF